MFRSVVSRSGSTALGAFLGCSIFFLLLQLPIAAGPPAGGGSGDVNGDQQVDIGDAVALLSYLFNGGPAPVACAGTACPACDLTQGEVDELSAILGLIDVDGNGNILITTPGSIAITAGSNATMVAGAGMSLSAGTTLDADASLITLN